MRTGCSILIRNRNRREYFEILRINFVGKQTEVK